MKCLIFRFIISGNIIFLLVFWFLGGVFWKVLVVLVFNFIIIIMCLLIIWLFELIFKKISKINVFGFLICVFFNLELL